MLSSKTLICGLVLVSAAFAGLQSSLNLAINNQISFTDEVIDQLYQQFLIDFAQDIPKTRHRDANVDRKQIFAANLESYLEHNSNPVNKWQKGINPFSDMTDSEFMAYYRIPVSAEQNCSATSTTTLFRDASQLLNVPEHFDWRD